MRVERLVRGFLTAVCAVCMFFPRVSVYSGCAWWHHFAWHFFHANIFHLAGNLLCLWIMKVRVRALWAFAIASAVSWLPCPVWSWAETGFVELPTVGLSGMLFASFGMAWGEYGEWRVMLRKVLPIVVATGLLPGVNVLVHLYCFFGGYAAGRIRRGLG